MLASTTLTTPSAASVTESPSGRGEVPLDRLGGAVAIQAHGAAEEVVGVEPAEHEVRHR